MNNVFLAGEKIDLCVPDEADFEQWAGWFNSQKVTQFLEQGKYPNSPTEQRRFFDDAVSTGRFLSLVKTKNGDLLGVISLSEINYEKLSCQVAYVCPEKSDKARYGALEALAICTQHAFERFGMERVWAGHAYPGLKSWIKKTELLGFKTNGFTPNGFRHGITTNDSVQTSIIKERYLALSNRRNGSLWPGENKVRKMLLELESLPALAQQVHTLITKLHQEHDQLIDQIELNASR